MSLNTDCRKDRVPGMMSGLVWATLSTIRVAIAKTFTTISSSKRSHNHTIPEIFYQNPTKVLPKY